MILLVDARWLLLLPLVFLLAFWSWRAGSSNLSRRRKTAALLIRLTIIGLLVLGLAGMSLGLPQNRQATVFVADLSASNAGNRSAMAAAINSAIVRRPTGGETGVVSMGRNAVVEQSASPATSFEGFETRIDADFTNIERGLELGAATLPNGYRRRLVVMTDGQQNVGDALATARLLRQQGVRVDVLPEQTTGGRDVRVSGVDVPSELRTRERFDLTVSLASNESTQTRIDIYRDRQLVVDREENVLPGTSRYVFSQPELPVGIHTYAVRIYPSTDSVPQNNSGSALTVVQGAPRVLVVAAESREAVNVVHSLQSTGIAVDLRLPAEITPTQAFLERYAAVVLVDTPAVALDSAFLTDLVPYVRDLGHGLVVIGGQNAYGLGAYGHTPLEDVLPVKMDLKRRRQIPSVAVALIIESLEAPLPVDISREAGRDVIALLSEQDQVAVNSAPDNGTIGWAIPMQHARDKQAMYRALKKMEPGDPPTYAPALRNAYIALEQTSARIKHIILLGDGDAYSSLYGDMVRNIRASGITVSTVITNGETDKDFQTMRNIARWGGGRYYRADDPTNVPRLFLREAQTFARSGVVSGKFYPVKLSANPVLRDVRAVPPLDGYVATQAKPSAEVVLASRRGDPVLATWQLGLGRAAAWTSDAAGLWSKSWLEAPGANRFWANLVSWTMPAQAANRLYVAASASGGSGGITVDTPATMGVAPTVSARVVSPDARASTVRMQPVTPGQFRGSFPASQQGSYFLSVLAKGKGRPQTAVSGVSVPYSAEYATIGTNMPFIRSLAAAGGGSVVADPRAIWRTPLVTVYDARSLADLFWLLALLLLPFDVAARRLVLGRGLAPHPATAGVAARRLGVASNGWTARRPKFRPSLGAMRGVVGAPRVQPVPVAGPASARPGSSGMRMAPHAGARPPGGQSTAGKLLEAKRRRQAESS